MKSFLDIAQQVRIEPPCQESQRRVLVVSYFFPPAGDVGGQRTLRFIKHLPQFGWEPIVLTTANGRVSRLDETLLEQIPSGIEVHRTHSFERLNYGVAMDDGVSVDGTATAKAGGIWSRLLCELPKDLWRLLAAPDDKLGWVPYAVREGRRLMEARMFDAICVSGKPFSSYFIGRALSRRFEVPWIMDLRDLWTLNRRQRPRNRLVGLVEKRMERRFVHSAARVIANTSDNRSDFLVAYPECNPDKFVVITNGYDRDDFANLPDDKPSKFTIGYAGVFYVPPRKRGGLYRRMMGLDGGHSRLLETHSPQAIFEALGRIAQRRPELRDRIEIVIAGAGCERARPLADQYGVADMVRLVGSLPYRESLILMKQAHLLLFVLARGEESRGWVPCKLYQYLGSGNPVLGLVPEGDAKDIVEETGSGVTCAPDDVAAIEQAILDFYERHQRGERPYQPQWSRIENYEARHLAGQLAECFDAVTPCPAERC